MTIDQSTKANYTSVLSTFLCIKDTEM